jgi:hypothetical protein
MGNVVNKKSNEEVANLFQRIIKVSVNPQKRLYKVTFDSNNNPVKATIALASSTMGHGVSSWDSKTFYSKFIYVEAFSIAEAKTKAKEIADKRVEQNT